MSSGFDKIDLQASKKWLLRIILYVRSQSYALDVLSILPDCGTRHVSFPVFSSTPQQIGIDLKAVSNAITLELTISIISGMYILDNCIGFDARQAEIPPEAEICISIIILFPSHIYPG